MTNRPNNPDKDKHKTSMRLMAAINNENKLIVAQYQPNTNKYNFSPVIGDKDAFV